ncbi:MAG: TlpA disulfide reductase family protein [Myxococcota bacterium]
MFLLSFALAAPEWQERFDRATLEALHDETHGELKVLAVGQAAELASAAICASPPGCTVEKVSTGRGRKPEAELLATSGGERTWIVRSVPGLEDAVVATLYQGSNPRARVLLQPELPVLTRERFDAQVEEIAVLRSQLDLARTARTIEPSAEEEQAAAALVKEISAAMDAGDHDEARRGLKELAARFPTTRASRSADRMRAELAVVGSEAPEPEVERWVQGEGFTMADHAATLVVFFEAWCPHCKREAPRFEALHERFGQSGLGVLGLTRQTRDVTDERLRSFLDDGGITYPVAQETGAESERYGVVGIPAAAIVKAGVVVWRGHPARITDALIESVLAD